MGTGYRTYIKIVVSGDVEEDVDTNNTEMIKAEISLICAKYGLDWSYEYGEDS